MITIATVLLALRWVPRRRTPQRCTAIDGPCDGHSWVLPAPVSPIWLSGEDGQWHLYRPTRPGGGFGYRYAGRTASYRELTRR